MFDTSARSFPTCAVWDPLIFNISGYDYGIPIFLTELYVLNNLFSVLFIQSSKTDYTASRCYVSEIHLWPIVNALISFIVHSLVFIRNIHSMQLTWSLPTFVFYISERIRNNRCCLGYFSISETENDVSIHHKLNNNKVYQYIVGNP